jgi:hypothetical protein
MVTNNQEGIRRKDAIIIRVGKMVINPKKNNNNEKMGNNIGEGK